MSNLLMEDYTPYPVVLQGARAVKELFTVEPPDTILDPSAGAGVFGQAFRQVWPLAQRSAIEPKKFEAWWLSQTYDQYAIGMFQDTLVQEGFDLVMTNPPFHSWEEFVEKACLVVSEGGYVVLLGLTAWGSRSESGYELFQRYCPVAQLRIPGAVSYRSRGNDTRDYCWWVFRRPLRTDIGKLKLGGWLTINLPRLSGKQRKWSNGRKPGRVHGEEFQEGDERSLIPSFRQRHLSRGLFDPREGASWPVVRLDDSSVGVCPSRLSVEPLV
jgi:hypothetical protein